MRSRDRVKLRLGLRRRPTNGSGAAHCGTRKREPLRSPAALPLPCLSSYLCIPKNVPCMIHCNHNYTSAVFFVFLVVHCLLLPLLGLAGFLTSLTSLYSPKLPGVPTLLGLAGFLTSCTSVYSPKLPGVPTQVLLHFAPGE